MNRSTRLLSTLLVLAGATAGAAPPPASAKKPAATKPAEGPRAKAHPVRGTRVSLVPPEGFVESPRFSGFQREETGASILVTELPVPFERLAQSFEAEPLAKKGLKLLGKETLSLEGGKAVLLQVEQEAAGTTFRKWMLLLGDEKETALVTGTFRGELEARDSAPLKAAVLTARRDPRAEAAPAEPLFTLERTPGLSRAHRLQNAILYTADGKLEGHAPEDPLLVVAPSLGDAGILDAQAYSEKRVRLTAQIKDVVLESGAPVEIDGLKGWELVARARDAKTGTPLVLHQVLLLEEGGYFLLQGLVGEARREEYLPHFQTAARSLKRKR